MAVLPAGSTSALAVLPQHSGSEAAMMPAAHADAFALKTLTAIRTCHHKTSTGAVAHSQPYYNNNNNINNGTSNAYTQNSNDARSQSPSVVAARRSTNASVSSSQQVALLVKRSSAEHASQGAAAAAKEASAPSPYDTLVSHLKVRMRRWQWAVLPDGSLSGAQGPFFLRPNHNPPHTDEEGKRGLSASTLGRAPHCGAGQKPATHSPSPAGPHCKPRPRPWTLS